MSETFSTAAELRKAQREVEAYHRFRQLSQELLQVNEKICRARPLEDSLSPEEKKRLKRSGEKSRAKVDQLLRVIFHDRRKTGRLDLEAIGVNVGGGENKGQFGG